MCQLFPHDKSPITDVKVIDTGDSWPCDRRRCQPLALDANASNHNGAASTAKKLDL